jgi:polysaccharide export outer membrane protein
MFHKLVAFVLMLVASGLCLGAQEMAKRDPEYRLQSSDLLEIKYRYTPEFDQTVNVGPDGRVSLTGLGTFVAKGMTLEEFKSEVVEISAKQLVEPDVAVILKEFEKPHIYVEGEVNSPGRVEIRSEISALDAIALAGGFKSSSKASSVLLLHRSDNNEHSKTQVLNLKRLISDHKLEEATIVQPGDVIYVPQNNLSKVERLAHLGQFGAIYSPVR